MFDMTIENLLALIALVVGPAAIIVFSYRAIRRGEARQLADRRERYRAERARGATHAQAVQRSGAAEEEVADLNR